MYYYPQTIVSYTFARSAHPSSIVLPTAVGKMNGVIER
jgi:hypothetical protein